MQVKLGAPDFPRGQADAQVALWLESGWWVTLRHEFAASPKAATDIVTSAADELSAFTAQATGARGDDASALQWEERRFAAIGPAVWGRR